MESNLTYYRRRAGEEFLAAIRAEHHKARRAHLDMSARYEDLIRALETAEDPEASEPVNESVQVIDQIKIYV